MRRIAFVGAACAALAASPTAYPEVRPGIALQFPRDHGAHPAYRTEWWYVTGEVKTAAGKSIGFQITFFRTTPATDQANPSKFAPRQILFAHAAISDPARARLLHGERIARGGFGIAEAKVGDTDVRIRDWRMKRLPDGRFAASVGTKEFALSLFLTPRQLPLAQGVGGYSQKGPRPDQASYYYSLPHLGVAGSVRNGRTVERVTGRAWLDREWSSDYLGGQAVGWDWTGLNFDDGAALMAFRIRGKDGRALWAGGTLRRAEGRMTRLAPEDVTFTPLTRWRSPRTRAVYPVSQRVTIRLPEGVRSYTLTPSFPDQELDGRRSGMPVYWEGLVRTTGGSGYLELTGYTVPLAM